MFKSFCKDYEFLVFFNNVKNLSMKFENILKVFDSVVGTTGHIKTCNDYDFLKNFMVKYNI